MPLNYYALTVLRVIDYKQFLQISAAEYCLKLSSIVKSNY